MARSVKRGDKQGQLRIIGGQWRGRKLSFIPNEGLRPTSDRIRETLFNWLTPSIHGARCADLFAGSGALGLEALSRGATHCDFVDTSQTVQQTIGRHLEVLQGEKLAHCHVLQAEQFLLNIEEPFDIVFIDPPFNHNLVAPVCALLAQRQLLNPNALVYVETGSSEPLDAMPPNWELHREKISGGVAYRLYSVAGEARPS